MNDLVSLFRNFIYRDLAFILGGSIFLLSFLYALHSYLGIDFKSFQSFSEEPYFLFLFTVLAYVVGYAVQDFGAVLVPWLIFTGYVLEPHDFWQRPYRRFTGSAAWRSLTFANTADAALQVAIHIDRLGIPEATLRDLERIRSLKVISMCVGGCSVLSAVIFLIAFFAKWACSRLTFIDLIAACLLVVFGLVLISLGWVKALQEMQFYEAMHAEKYPEKKLPEVAAR